MNEFHHAHFRIKTTRLMLYVDTEIDNTTVGKDERGK